MDFGRQQVPRKRKYFDVPPPSLNESVTQSSIVNSSEILISNVIDKLNSISSILPVWVPATHYAFTLRLEKALQKNFEYIDMKDNQPEEFALRTQSKTSTSSTSLDATSSSSISSHYYNNINRKNLKKVVNLSGIGSKESRDDTIESATFVQENSSVYITGLPSDMTQSEVDILFSSQGKIKKVKFYLDDLGKRKNDCLLTYLRRESALLAVTKLNGIDIGDGYILTVSLADFKKTTNDKCSTSQNDSSEHVTVHADGEKSAETSLCLDQHELSYFENILDNLENSEKTVIEECDFQKLINSLNKGIFETEFDFDECPLVVISNAYDIDKYHHQSYIDDTEADILIMCCQYGKVKSVLTPHVRSIFRGCMFIIFLDRASAISCGNELHTKWFHQRQLKVLIFVPAEQLALSNNFEHTGIRSQLKSDDQDNNFDIENFFNNLL